MAGSKGRRDNLVAIDGDLARWQLPPDLDDHRRRMARDLLGMVHAKTGVTSVDIEAVANICRCSMRLDQLREHAQAAWLLEDMKEYANLLRLIQQHERQFRTGIGDMGLNPNERSAKNTRSIAAKGGNATTSEWGDGDIA